MSNNEIDFIEALLNSPYEPDCPFDGNYNVEAAIDEYIDRCMRSKS